MMIDQFAAENDFIFTFGSNFDFFQIQQIVLRIKFRTVKDLTYAIKGSAHNRAAVQVVRVKPEKLKQQSAEQHHIDCDGIR